jgi:hypothetical protein
MGRRTLQRTFDADAPLTQLPPSWMVRSVRPVPLSTGVDDPDLDVGGAG